MYSGNTIEDLLKSLGGAFDLRASTPAGTLGDLLRQRLSRLDLEDQPDWGTSGSISQVAAQHSEALDFYYRPHLFPEMSAELRLAHRLQFDLLPRELPPGSPVSIAAVLESFCHLSGDLIGWRQETDGFLCWIVDVSGHGVRAGMASAVLHFVMSGIAPDLELSELASLLNTRMLESRNPEDSKALFATAFFARITPAGECTYLSAGHPPMLHRHADGVIDWLPAQGLPLGLLPTAVYATSEFLLGMSDLLFLYTDGLLEATDPQGEEFGVDRIEQLVASGPGETLPMSKAAYDRVQEHKQNRLLDDDLTFLTLGLGG